MVVLLNWLHRLKRQYILRRARIPERQWKDCVARLPVLHRLSHTELHRLRELASLFLYEKTLNGTRGFIVTDEIRNLVAAQACLLILNLDLDYYSGWSEIIIYADSFIVQHDEVDEIGLVHRNRRALGGESWSHGPVIISWADASPVAVRYHQGGNVILHEFAHKLDMLNGDANGMPPLHRDMDRERWTRSFTQAYELFSNQLEYLHHTTIDPYAATSPAEFFAVMTEYFFEAPETLHEAFPAVYEELRVFYRQAPLSRDYRR
jgi:MtfA peptidase